MGAFPVLQPALGHHAEDLLDDGTAAAVLPEGADPGVDHGHPLADQPVQLFQHAGVRQRIPVCSGLLLAAVAVHKGRQDHVPVPIVGKAPAFFIPCSHAGGPGTDLAGLQAGQDRNFQMASTFLTWGL